LGEGGQVFSGLTWSNFHRRTWSIISRRWQDFGGSVCRCR